MTEKQITKRLIEIKNQSKQEDNNPAPFVNNAAAMREKLIHDLAAGNHWHRIIVANRIDRYITGKYSALQQAKFMIAELKK